MSVGRVASLVNTAWLSNQLTKTPSGFRVLDSSWTALKSGYQTYLGKHIPKAQFFDLNHCVKATPLFPRKPPELDCFERYAKSLGINPDTSLIVYDRGGMLAAARTWWTFRMLGHDNIAVLDGGMKKWEHDGYETETGLFKLSEHGGFEVKPNNALIKHFEEVVELAKQKTNQIIDARRPEHYMGEEQEPTHFTINALEGMGQTKPSKMHGGHLTGSVNFLEDLVLTEEDVKTMKARDDLLILFEEKGVDLSRPLTTMCYNGHAACLLALAAAVCGKLDTAVYAGSWTEMGQRLDSPFLTQGPTSSSTSTKLGG